MLPILVATIATGCDGLSNPDEESLEQDVVTSCTAPAPPSPIVFDRELVIRSLYVVEDGVSGDGNDEANDHCRTSWNACAASKQGRWTFGYMMAAMAGTSDVTSTAARQFVRDWLKQWLSAQQPNTSKDPAAPRTAIIETLIDPWLAASGCPGATLDTCLPDLKKAPFRLLAFVNRIDLPTIASYSGGGEFRVVFGALGYDPINCVSHSCQAPLQATVIFEYNLPAASLFTWSVRFHGFSALNPEDLTQTATFRDRLQLYTDAIVGPTLSPGPNRSAISHVRTSEIAFDCQMGTASCGGLPPDPTLAQWEFRQFRLNGPNGASGVPLTQEAVSQTPQSTDNGSAAINNQLVAFRAGCLAGDPAFRDIDGSLLGNASQSPAGIGALVWERGVLNATNAPEMTAAQRAQTRHQFGFGTCNGCHYAETGNQNGLFHIAPREEGVMSTISNFLSAGGASNPVATADGLVPTTYQTVIDPAGSGTNFKYNEPWRRACEIRRILAGISTPLTKPTGHLR